MADATIEPRARAHLATLPPVQVQIHAAGSRVDWPMVIIQIQRSTWLAGASQRMSHRAIADACGRGENWVWALKNIPGTEPKFHDGLMLLGLWSEKVEGGTLPLHREGT
jgi:hypothetical protein